MKTYHASSSAVRLIQLIVLLLGAILCTASAFLLASWTIVMRCAVTIFAVLSVFSAFLLIPLYFRRLACTLTSSHIHVCSGVWFQREESIRLQTIQFVQILSGPFNGALGMNFLFFHAYGGSIQAFCLSTQDRDELIAFLQKRGICHVP